MTYRESLIASFVILAASAGVSQTADPNPFAVWGGIAIALIATSIIVGWYLRGRRGRRR